MFGSLFNRTESLLAIDIGATTLKVVELERDGDVARLVNVAVAPLPPNLVANNAIQNTEAIAEQIGAVLEANNIEDKRVVTCIPGPSAFTKRIKMPRSNYSELAAAVHLEAGNFIPDSLDAVKLDFQVMRPFGKNQLEVIVVAVKNEILENYVEAIALAGLEAAVVDVDYFALQNIFEHAYPEFRSKTVACVNIGHRFSSICICRDGDSLFTGDISAGGKLIDEALSTQLSLGADQIAAVKQSFGASGDAALPSGIDVTALSTVLAGVADELAVEFNRQLSFFWNASGADEGIEMIFLAGGAAKLPGLVESLNAHTGISCALLDPFKRIESGEDFDRAFLADIGPNVAVAMGLGLREPGDKGDSELLSDEE